MGCGSGQKAKWGDSNRRNEKGYRYEAATPRRYYHCHDLSRRLRCRERPYIRAGRLEDVVWSEVKRVLQDPALIVAGIEALGDGEGGGFAEEPAKAERELRAVQMGEDQAIRLYLSGAYAGRCRDFEAVFRGSQHATLGLLTRLTPATQSDGRATPPQTVQSERCVFHVADPPLVRLAAVPGDRAPFGVRRLAGAASNIRGWAYQDPNHRQSLWDANRHTDTSGHFCDTGADTNNAAHAHSYRRNGDPDPNATTHPHAHTDGHRRDGDAHAHPGHAHPKPRQGRACSPLRRR